MLLCKTCLPLGELFNDRYIVVLWMNEEPDYTSTNLEMISYNNLIYTKNTTTNFLSDSEFKAKKPEILIQPKGLSQ